MKEKQADFENVFGANFTVEANNLAMEIGKDKAAYYVCGYCGGSGQINGHDCPDCGGHGVY